MIKKAVPGQKDTETYRYYPSICDRNKIGTQELAKHLSTGSSLTEVDIRRVIWRLAEELPALLLANNSVEIEGLGVFSLEIKGLMSETPEQVTFKKIKNVSLNLRVANRLKQELKQASFTKEK